MEVRPWGKGDRRANGSTTREGCLDPAEDPEENPRESGAVSQKHLSEGGAYAIDLLKGPGEHAKDEADWKQFR